MVRTLSKKRGTSKKSERKSPPPKAQQSNPPSEVPQGSQPPEVPQGSQPPEVPQGSQPPEVPQGSQPPEVPQGSQPPEVLQGSQPPEVPQSGPSKKRNLGWYAAILLLFIFGFICWRLFPRSSTICFDGTADQASFSVPLDKLAAYGIKSDAQYNGKLVFSAEETETIYVVEASMPEEEIRHIQKNGYPDWESSSEVFPFIDGSATLSALSEAESESRLLMNLMLEPQEGESLTYNIEITRVKEDGKTEINQIELNTFSSEPIIKLYCACDINMKGTMKTIPAGLYRIVGCRSIKFFAVPGGSKDPENGYYSQLNMSLNHFNVMNAEKCTFEITYSAKTEFREIGYVEVEGAVQAGRWLELEIGDIGQYPIPVKIRGCAGELKAAGKTLYPSLWQLFTDKFPDLFMVAILTTVFTCLINRVKRGLQKG